MNDLITSKLLLDALGDAGEPGGAARILEATIAVLFQGMTTDERATFARALSPGLCDGLPMTGDAEAFDADELHRRIAQRARMGASASRERVEVIVEAIGRQASPDVLRRLRHAFPPSIAALLEERELREPPPYVETFPAAQRHSVVRSDNPHGARKLSSGQPVLQRSDATRSAR